MGILHHFFKSRDINRRVKYWIYLAGPVNTLLWGSETWNLSQMIYNKPRIFIHPKPGMGKNKRRKDNK